MSGHATSGSAAVPGAPAGEDRTGGPVPPVACEPGPPVSAGPWDTRSWALLPVPGGGPGGAAIPAQSSGGTGKGRGDRVGDDASGDGAGGGNGGGAGGEAPSAVVRRPVGPADPVRELMYRHRELCERAVDPLEIAAGLEALGVTDRTAARFRHRDVFALAEELFARVPRAGSEPEGLLADADVRSSAQSGTPGSAAARAAGPARSRASRYVLSTLLALLPALLTAAGLLLPLWTPVRQAGGAAHVVLVALTATGVGAAVRLAVCRLARAKAGMPTMLCACWLTGCAVLGERLPGGGAEPAGGPFFGAVDGVVALSLAVAVAPAVWCARWFASRARRRLAASRTLDDFAAGVWPLLTVTVVLFGALLLGLQLAVGEAGRSVVRGQVTQAGGDVFPAGALASATALGMLLFTALLLTAHGFRRAASAGLGAACVLHTAVLAAGAFPAARAALPQRPQFVAAAVCACVALGLLGWAYRLLSGAFAHHGTGRGQGPGNPGRACGGEGCEHDQGDRDARPCGRQHGDDLDCDGRHAACGAGCTPCGTGISATGRAEPLWAAAP